MAALRSHGMVRIHVIKKLLDWPAVRLVRHQVEPGQVRQPSERHRPSTLCHPEAEGLRCVMSPAGRKPSVLDHWTGRHDSTQVLKRISVDRHDRFRRPRGEDFGPELARVRNGFPAPMQRGEIGRPEGHKIRRHYARLDEVACGFGHTNDAPLFCRRSPESETAAERCRRGTPSRTRSSTRYRFPNSTSGVRGFHACPQDST